MSVARRYHLRKDQIQELSEKLAGELEELKKLLGRGRVEVLELAGGERIISVDEKPTLLMHGERPVPLLTAVHLAKLKRVVVDMGAVPHVVNGADVMAPGVVSAEEEIEPGTFVVVVDERHEKPLAIGSAMTSGREMKGPGGKVIKNLHHVGDKIWDLTHGTG